MSITLRPIPRALVPIDADAASRVSAPNYDEFQEDEEIWRFLRSHPDCVLRVTMAHCDVDSSTDILESDSDASLEKAGSNMRDLIEGPLTREVENVLFVYEITGPRNPGVRQIGLGGMARTAEIRTEATPRAPIIRNEGVREPKARGRADLIEATDAIIGIVNNAVPDVSGSFAAGLEAYADARVPDFETRDHHGNDHRIWLIEDPEYIGRMEALLAAEPEAYVADGNHRSAAAAMLGYADFLTVFFTADRMGISPYNRLVLGGIEPVDGLEAALARSFEIGGGTTDQAYQPRNTRQVGLYGRDEGWLHLRALPSTHDPRDAAQSIDHDIVQRKLFGDLFGILDPRDDRLAFVGANKNAEWLRQRVDEGRAVYAITLAPVTMEQFVEVCRQDKMMPPKSTWFEPKIRSGLVMALLD